MTDHQLRALEAIEQAQRERPFCRCGRPTRPIERGDAMWLECTTLQDSATGRPAGPARMMRTFEHVRRPIVDLGAAA